MTEPTDRREWRCFHCDELFTDYEAALEHFGFDQTSYAACQIDIKAFREMENFTARCQAEDSDTDRAMYRMQTEHDVALRREEEAGYAKGLRDGRRETIEELHVLWRWADSQGMVGDQMARVERFLVSALVEPAESK
jgi:hypothetical protein